jgi:hypothetical protein
VTLEALHCQTDQPVDDALAKSLADGIRCFQEKHSIALQTKRGSKFAPVIDRFVRQYLVVKNSASTVVSSSQQLDPDSDRFVLVTSRKNSRPVRRDLPSFLMRNRQLVPQKSGGTLKSVSSSASDHDAFGVVRDQRFTGTDL